MRIDREKHTLVNMSEQPKSYINLQNELEVLRRSHHQLEQHNAILLRLAMAQQKSGLDFKQTLQTFSKEVSSFLNVARVGIWVYSHDKSKLRCLELFDSNTSEHSSGAELLAADFPAYFSALEQQRVVSAIDAVKDSRTSEFATTYLHAHNISSMLDSPIHVAGDLRGVMCCEQVGTIRKWTENEQRFTASVTDLLASSIAANDMRRAKETLQTLLESAAQGIIAINESGKMTLVNSLVEKLFGFNRDEIIGHPLEKLIPNDINDRNLKILDGNLTRSFSDCSGSSQYLTGYRKNGTKFPIEIALSFVEHDGEHLALALLTDITERLESERKIRESEYLYRTIVEDQTDLISRCTPDGKRIFVNQAYCKFLGKNQYELLGKSIYDNIPPNDRIKVKQSFASLSKQNPIHIYEHRVLRQDGKLILTQWLDHAIYDESGTIKEIQSIGRDITVLKEAEARLREAQRLESLAVLASGIAHDFNNLLTPILIYAEGLTNCFEKDSIEENQILQIHAAAQRAKSLVSQILTFGRSSHESKREPTAIAPIIQDTIQLIRASVPKEIDFYLSLDEDCGLVEASATELYQVLSNLCTNACQAMPNGGVLNISSSVSPDKNNHLKLLSKIIVKDSGSGISQDNIKKIYDPFFSTKSLTQGSGLGLSVVHGIVNSLGGTIEVQSTVGEGTTFVVYLPCIDKQVRINSSIVPNNRITSGSEHILLVDDEKSVLESMQFMLEKLGYQVTSCKTAKDAIAYFSQNPNSFDILITDYTMPEINGIELIGAIQEEQKSFPAILMTGFAGLLDDTEIQRAGIKQCVQKPLNAKEINKIIQGCIKSERSASKTEKNSENSDTLESILLIDDDELVCKAMKNLLSSIGYQPTVVSSINEAREALNQKTFKVVFVDHMLDGKDGFAEAENLRKTALNKSPDNSLRIIGMSGSTPDQKISSYSLDGYLNKPFSVDELIDLLGD